jgi:dipeptidyl aminopeptidase/acylaminoacyl peptidase
MLFVLLIALPIQAVEADSGYKKPPKAVLDVLNSPPIPAGFLSPTRETLLLARPLRYPPLADLAQPILRLAGVLINPKNNGERGFTYAAFPFYWSAFSLVRISDGVETAVELPSGPHLGSPQWSADGKYFAFTNATENSVELWVAQTATAKATRFDAHVNNVLGSAISWMPDQKTLLVKLVPPDRGPPPAAPLAPSSPRVEESLGDGRASSTYEARDVLKNPHDEDLFDYYCATQLALVNVETGKVSPIGKPAAFTQVAPSPDGAHILVKRIHRPYSYLVAYERFPREVEVWNPKGQLLRSLASLPLAEQVPIHGVPTGPREHSWQATAPATIIWAEALDGGDPRNKVPHRDRVLASKAPFDGKPTEVFKARERYVRAQWGERDGLALIHEYDPIRYQLRTSALNVNNLRLAPQLIWDRNVHERYKDPGSPVTRVLPSGFEVIEQDEDSIFLAGAGASSEGDRPFLDRFNLRSRQSERLFRSDKSGYESFTGWVDRRARVFMTRFESPTDVPNYYLRTLQASTKGAPGGESSWTSARRPLTRIPDPTPQLRGITKQIVSYKRTDGTPLSMTLYLPPGYQKGTRLPTVLYAYPLDHTDPSTAGQVVGSTQRFNVFIGASELFFLLDGYAVIHSPAMPVIGDSNTAYDTFIEQVVANAKAAVDQAVLLGVTDPERVGAMGHSHGGLMTATLIGHSELFRAGIALSGAYNHTVRPFGFQNERRTYWQAPETYVKLSPVLYADKINKPLLIIHGEVDSNPGTVSQQSEKLYQAIKGTGGTARLVMLPLESHLYIAQESVEHTLYEMLSWFDRYVKKAAPRKTAQILKQ